MDTKLECVVDVEGTDDMTVRGEKIRRSRPSTARNSPRAHRQVTWAVGPPTLPVLSVNFLSFVEKVIVRSLISSIQNFRRRGIYSMRFNKGCKSESSESRVNASALSTLTVDGPSTTPPH